MAELRSCRGANAAHQMFNHYHQGTWKNHVPHVAASFSAATSVVDARNQRVGVDVTAAVSPGTCSTSWGCKHGTSVSSCLSSRRPGSLWFSRAYSGNGTREEPLYKSKTAYYEILEVPSTSTQAQIKTAYYKQSFIYHPDRNAGSDEATERFSEISEAYSVLGNKGLRKKYDRGLLSQMDLTSASRPQPKVAKAQTSGRQSVMGTRGPDAIFNFDKFFKSHYGEQLQREKNLRQRREELLQRKQRDLGEAKTDQIVEATALVSLVIAAFLFIGLR